MKSVPFHRVRFAPALVIALALAAAQGSADWAPNGNRVDQPNSGVSNSTFIGADSVGGLLVGFNGPPSCSRVLRNGDIAAGWPTTVILNLGGICSPVPDGLAGAYVAAADYSPSPPRVTVRHLRFDATSDPAWPAGGLEICSAPRGKYLQAGPDGAGGTYVFWADGRNADASTGGLPPEIYGTRVLADGSIAPGWAALGTLLAAAAESVAIRVGPPRPDGAGGAFALIERSHPFLAPDERDDYLLLHVRPDGTLPPGWPSGGLLPPNLTLGQGFTYEPDCAGGTYVTWVTPQGGTFGSRLLRLLASGDIAPGWPAAGVPDLEDSTRVHFIQSLAADEAGGVFAWMAIDTSGISQPIVNRVLHFEASGKRAAGWPAEGRRLPEPPDTNPVWIWESPHLLASDARGGVFAVWAQTADVYANFATIGAIHLGPHGEPVSGWPGGGHAVCDTLGQRTDIQMVADGAGAAYVVWNDHRPQDQEGSFFAYASRIDRFDDRTVVVGDAGSPFGTLRAAPNPFAGIVDLRMTLAEAGPVRLEILDVSGRSVRRVTDGWLPAGTYTRRWDGRNDAGSEAPTGLYLVRGNIGGQTVRTRLVRIR